MTRSREKRIVFLDDDHVVRIARLLLEQPTPEGDRELTSFFEPEDHDLAVLRKLGAGLSELDGVDVSLFNASAEIPDADVIAFRRGSVTQTMIERNPRLKLVQRLGSNSSGIDLDAAAANGVGISCLARKTLAHAAEHAMLLMLALAKKLRLAEAAARSGSESAATGETLVSYNWAGLKGIVGLHGRTLGVIGLGEVGNLLATRARAFGMKVLYTERHRLSGDQEQAMGIEYSPLDELLSRSHVISIHVAGAENAGLIGNDALSRMRPDAFLINTSRGSMVDEDALFSALAERKIAGAGLDVRANEPSARFDRFAALDNVVLTPHISGGSHLDVLDELQCMFDNMRAVFAGVPLVHDVLLQPRQVRLHA